jgi:LysB family phage lysis regulatory protein
MTAILRTLAPYALSLVLAVFLWFQRGQIESQDIAIKTYGEIIEGQASDLASLTDRMTGQRLDLLQLERTQEEIRNALDQRTFDIERLKNEDPQVRSWADSLLPDPIARLRGRPAVTGAAAYAEYLRTRDAVQPAGGGPEVERRHGAAD